MSKLLAQYGSESEQSEHEAPSIKKPRLEGLNSAPDVPGVQSQVALYDLHASTSTALVHNVPYTALAQPVVGPANPFTHVQAVDVGKAEEYVVDDHQFRTQMRMFHAAQVRQAQHQVVQHDVASGVAYIDPSTVAAPAIKRKRKALGDAAVLDGENAYRGPWGGFDDDDDEPGRGIDAVADDDLDAPDEIDPSSAASVPSSNPKSRLITPGAETSIFHGKNERNYIGRTYMAAPTVDGVDLFGEPGEQECFLPKRCLFTYRGHTKGVNAIRVLPKTGHLFLSASMDGKVKLWDVYNDRRVLRTFLGHNKGVRDIAFNNDGTQFLSASYDRYLKLWDTETGKCLGAFTTGKVPQCVTFNPDPDKQHIFLTGQQDKKIYQFDVRSGEIVQEYDQHLGPVNTITFVDDNRRFVTTSDDKSLRAWEFDIPVVIKYIAEPHMHSMPAVSLSPNKKWLACQSLDNQIMLYAVTDKFRLNRKKCFRGHLVAGYACELGFSPDSRFLMSGDSTGSMFYWDFKTCKLLKKHKAHDQVVMGCEWLPHETSKVLTCSWDGTIKLWD
ncbi:hypothetical protein GGF31_001777 [Allomyces arbusculus]|nr:hypothetical protein GGF31_001777 [Allomyces arbusculus]